MSTNKVLMLPALSAEQTVRLMDAVARGTLTLTRNGNLVIAPIVRDLVALTAKPEEQPDLDVELLSFDLNCAGDHVDQAGTLRRVPVGPLDLLRALLIMPALEEEGFRLGRVLTPTEHTDLMAGHSSRYFLTIEKQAERTLVTCVPHTQQVQPARTRVLVYV